MLRKGETVFKNPRHAPLLRRKGGAPPLRFLASAEEGGKKKDQLALYFLVFLKTRPPPFSEARCGLHRRCYPLTAHAVDAALAKLGGDVLRF
jgi:hypothetical protein